MLVYVQWAKAHPTDYDVYEIASMRDVRRLPRKGIPSGGETLDDNAGWLSDVVVQGVSFEGWDHASADFPAPGVLRVIVWNDDPVDYPDGPWAQVWDFHDPVPDARHGVNTLQYLTVYTDVPALIAFWTGQSTTGGPVVVLPWADFPQPAANVTLHGIWVDDALYQQHLAVRTRHGWREWIK